MSDCEVRARDWFNPSASLVRVESASVPRGGLVLPDGILVAMIDHLAACLPIEGVGLLSVVDGPNAWIADRYYPGRNTDWSPTRFTMDPADVATALADMGPRMTRLGAIVHSHPRTPPVPSTLDLSEATIPGALSVIVGFAPRVAVRAWRLTFGDEGRAIDAVEAPFRIVAGVHGKRSEDGRGRRADARECDRRGEGARAFE